KFLYNGNSVFEHRKTRASQRSVPPSLDMLPQALASLVYGCMFQSLYLRQNLNDCINRNGMHDFSLWRASLIQNNLLACSSRFKRVEDQHFDNLRDNNAILQLLLLNPDQFLTEDEYGRYHADIENLRTATRELIQQHYEVYGELIDAYNNIISLGEN